MNSSLQRDIENIYIYSDSEEEVEEFAKKMKKLSIGFEEYKRVKNDDVVMKI